MRMVCGACSALALATMPAVLAAEVAPADATVKAPTLGEMKSEFAALMNERAELARQVKENQEIILGARATTGPDATSVAYREAVQRLEKAIDEHPAIRQILEKQTEAQAEQADLSRQQAAILDAWNQAREERSRQLKDMIARVVAKAEAEKQAILNQAGVKEDAQVSEEDRRKVRDIYRRMTNELAIARADYTRVSATNAVQAAREADGSAARFEACNARHAEIARKKSDIENEMMRLRTTLRTDDPAIAQLQQAAREASQAHVVSQDARPEAAAARAFLTGVDAKRAAIDARARVLRQAIVKVAPESKAELDKQSAAAGLYLVGEGFWEIK
jgi:hypothetical protein